MHSSDIPRRGYRIIHLPLRQEVGPFTYRPSDSRAEVQLADEHAAQTGAVAFLVASLSAKGLHHIT